MITATQGKRERNRQRWFERIRAWEKGGLSQRAFIEQHGLNTASFHRWKRIYRSESGGVRAGGQAGAMPANTNAGLVPVEILRQSHPGGPGVMLELNGAKASALLFSLVETANANALEPWAYLNYLFENYPRAKTNEDILALLPHNLKQKNLTLALPSIP